MNPVLQLNADYTPMKIASWERAVEMILCGSAVSVVDIQGRFIRSERLVLPWPAVIALRRYQNVRARVRFNARAILARDAFTCQYCGFAPTHPDGRPDRDQLTMDHVVPRAQAVGGKVTLYWARKTVNVTCWENATTACKRCNQRKADRTPAQAGLVLRSIPRLPTQTDILRMQLAKLRQAPAEWADFLPGGAARGTEGSAADVAGARG